MPQEIPVIFFDKESQAAARKRGTFRLLLATMRPHQWVKNLFIFAPLLFGKKLTDPLALKYAGLAFLAFCFLASAFYIFNDWIDAAEDRAHPVKCNRPISSGLLSIPIALFSAGIMVIISFGIAALIGLNFFIVAAVYFILTLSYCLALKRMIVLDAMTISVGFVLRVVGGAIAVGVMPTHWLIVCTFLLALFLAFSKRRQELLSLSNNAAEHRSVLSLYSVDFLEKVNTVITSAVIVCYALYTVAPETTQRFETENLIYGTVFVIYGMLRYMALINNPVNGGNPSKMLLEDRPLLLTVVCWSIYNAIIIYHISLKELWFFGLTN